ncbi:MAG: HIT family protein [Candidatus Nanopelagicales bacterium]
MADPSTEGAGADPLIGDDVTVDEVYPGVPEAQVVPGGVGAAPGAGQDKWDRLWTPHRLQYIRSANAVPGERGADEAPAEPACPFCRVPSMPEPESLIVHRGDVAFVVLNLYPYNSGHLLVCPYRHVADYTQLNRAEIDEVADLTQRCMVALRAAAGPQGFNIGMNQGKIAGAGVADHLHQHVVPRWRGDINFMPIVGGTKTMPMLLEQTRDLVAEYWPG